MDNDDYDYLLSPTQLHMEEAIIWMMMMIICSLTWRYFVLHTIEVTPGFQGVAIVGFPSLLTLREKTTYLFNKILGEVSQLGSK